MHHEAGTRISFEVLNVGDAGGNARLGIEVMIPLLPSGSHSIWTQGRVKPVMRIWVVSAKGEHTALVYVNPGSGQSDHSTNTFTVE